MPWVAPTAAIVFAASTGFLDRSFSSEQVAQAPTTVAYDINVQAQTAPEAAALAPSNNAEEAGVLTRLSILRCRPFSPSQRPRLQQPLSQL